MIDINQVTAGIVLQQRCSRLDIFADVLIISGWSFRCTLAAVFQVIFLKKLQEKSNTSRKIERGGRCGFRGHYILPAMPKGRVHTSFGPKFGNHIMLTYLDLDPGSRVPHRQKRKSTKIFKRFTIFLQNR